MKKRINLDYNGDVENTETIEDKNAKWELFSFGFFEDDTTAFICSNCGMIVDVFLTEGKYNPKDMGYNYCPRCGRKMRG